MIFNSVNNNKVSFSTYIVIIFFIVSISGYSINLYNYFVIGIYIVWLFACFLECPNKMLNLYPKYEVLLFKLFFLIFIFITSLKGSTFFNSIKYFGLYLLLFSYLTIFLYYKDASEKNIKTLIYSILIIWMFYVMKAIIFYLKNPDAARQLAQDAHIFNNISIGGGYNLAYGSAILCVFLISVLILYENKIGLCKNILMFLIIILLIIVVIMTKSTITIIAMFVGIFLNLFLLLLPNSKRKNLLVEFFKTLLLLTISVIIFSVVINPEWLGNLLISIVNKTKDTNVVSLRLYELGEFLKNNMSINENSYIYIRLYPLDMSINTFIENLLIGIGYKYGYIASLEVSYGIGQHSELFDALARFGLLGGFFYISIFISICIFIIKKTSIKKSIGWISTFIIMFIFNPFNTIQGNSVMYFIVPMIIVLFNLHKERKKNYGI